MTTILSSALALLLLVSAALKLSHRSKVVAAYTRLGVPESRLNLLACALLAGAAGLLVGLAWAPVALAASAALSIYFFAAIVVHLRARDYAGLAVPVLYGGLAAAILSQCLACI